MIRAVVVGATGYTGAELVRLDPRSPRGRAGAGSSAHSKAGRTGVDVLPSLAGLDPG